ncbi:molybdopterin synthase sulfur carrier subunit [Candidatus Bathyarchaeota archaeon]|nr:MAG: molybdopterin synthase sulfur carrier subunit [Candidatus Bathyarchaeota archaeon]
MRVRVLVFGELSTRLGWSLDVEMGEAPTIRGLLKLLSDRAGASIRVDGGVTVLVNGRNVNLLGGLDTELRDGDLVVLLPPLSGG